MITIDSVLSKKNTKAAFNHLATKGNGGGTDTAPLLELREYWDTNGERIQQMIRNGEYQPGLIMEYEIVNGRGKRRDITKLGQTDRLINRMLAQKLNTFFGPKFLTSSHAYQENKGVQSAVEQARGFIELGNEFVIEIDIKAYFDEINIERLIEILKKDITDQAVMSLIKSFLYCKVSRDGDVRTLTKGIMQGAAISPVLSNLYLHDLDQYMENAGYKWVRFADNICIYVESMDRGCEVFEEIVGILKEQYMLPINDQKSGVYDVYDRWFLGYEFSKKGKKVFVNKHIYQKSSYYRDWHPCVVTKVNREFHILQDGVLNKKDYALLFENEEEKHHIPIEATEQLNLYNEVMITSAVLRTITNEGIRLAIYDKHGDLLGYYIPENYAQDSKAAINQCLEYADAKRRLQIAKRMETAAIHNVRANLRYYKKRIDGLDDIIEELSLNIQKFNECKSIDELLLLEARCRQIYYQAFNQFIDHPAFAFKKRTKRPPMDEINALISFGNTLLYNRIQQIIWKTPLDSRIGIFHAANKRHHSLNLDFADLFKPIIVDRIIFTIINKKQITEQNFIHRENGGVYLDEKGKRLFLEAFEDKLKTKINVKGQSITYFQLMEQEVRAYQHHIMEGADYKPYKYY